MPGKSAMVRAVVQGVADWTVRVDANGTETQVDINTDGSMLMTSIELRVLASAFEAAADLNDACREKDEWSTEESN